MHRLLLKRGGNSHVLVNLSTDSDNDDISNLHGLNDTDDDDDDDEDDDHEEEEENGVDEEDSNVVHGRVRPWPPASGKVGSIV